AGWCRGCSLPGPRGRGYPVCRIPPKAPKETRTMRWRTAAAVWLVLGLAGLGAARAQEKQPAEKAQPATLRIKMPMANATLTINGVQTQQTGVERKFVTPPL